jgi:GcrA cell cycle regulator
MPDPNHACFPIWTRQREAQALRLFLREGLTAAEVAEVLGGVTRAAVISKIHRLGFLKRAGQPTAERVTASIRRPRIDSRLPPKRPLQPMPELREVPSTGEPCPLAGLPAGACHWPVDDPGPGRMHLALFCAGPAPDGVYCAAHRALAGR